MQRHFLLGFAFAYLFLQQIAHADFSNRASGIIGVNLSFLTDDNTSVPEDYKLKYELHFTAKTTSNPVRFLYSETSSREFSVSALDNTYNENDNDQHPSEWAHTSLIPFEQTTYPLTSSSTKFFLDGVKVTVISNNDGSQFDSGLVAINKEEKEYYSPDSPITINLKLVKPDSSK